MRDRTVEAALRHVLEPIFERDFAESSYGFRPGRGTREAVARVEELLSQGHGWCVDADLKSDFDTLPHDRLTALVKQRIMEQRGWALVRYADDFVVLCRTPEEAQTVLAFLRQWTEAAGLTLHPTKTRIVRAEKEGFDFLGWHFRGGQKWPRKKSLQKLREKLRPLTRRTNGRSLSEIMAKANPILRGGHGSCAYG